MTRACVSALTRWRKPLWLKRGMTRHGVQKEGCHDRRFQQGLGSAVQGQTDLRSVVRGGINPAHQLPRNASSVSGLSILPTGHTGTSCASTLRQQVRGVIHKSPGRPHLERLCMLANNLLVWAQNNLRSLKAMHVQGKMNQGADMLLRKNVSSEEWTLHRLTVQKIWEIFASKIDLFASKDNSHCPIFFTRSTDALAHEWPILPLYAFPPNRFATAGTQTSQGTMAQASLNSPPLEEPLVGVRIIPAADGSPVANPPETGPPFKANGTIWHDMAFTAQVMGSTCVAARREPFCLPEHVLNTMAEARAPSTRRFYTPK